ncbi:MAG: 4Fe-4S binding protein [Clostridia bacterium]
MVRRFTQLAATLGYNANISGFFSGRIFRGASKGLCVPGLNCYSCPGAVGACPMGALQSGLAAGERPYYVVGTLLLFGVLLGRFICGFLCPFGLVQDLLYKIPSPKLKKSNVTHCLSYLKYAVLLALAIWLPLYMLAHNGIGSPTFCKFICPAGTLGAGIPMVLQNANLRASIGFLFSWKCGVLLAILVLSVFMLRTFCRFLCPLGAIYSLFNRVAIFGIRVDKDKCTGCGACVRFCKLDVRHINSLECVRCGECKSVCAHNAIYMVTPKTLFMKKENLK